MEPAISHNLRATSYIFTYQFYHVNVITFSHHYALCIIAHHLTYKYAHTHRHTRTYTHTRMQAYMHTQAHTYMHTHTYTHTHAHRHAHTHIHTHAQVKQSIYNVSNIHIKLFIDIKTLLVLVVYHNQKLSHQLFSHI